VKLFGERRAPLAPLPVGAAQDRGAVTSRHLERLVRREAKLGRGRAVVDERAEVRAKP